MAGTRIDYRSLAQGTRAVDMADVAVGTVGRERPVYAEHDVLDSLGEREWVATRPGYLRVVTTITADTVAVVASAMLAGWIGGLLTEAPLVHRIFTDFGSRRTAARSASCCSRRTGWQLCGPSGCIVPRVVASAA